MEKLLNSIKKHLDKLGNKKLINNLFIMLTIGIILIIITNIIIGEKKDVGSKMEIANTPEKVLDDELGYEFILERKLEDILGQMIGVNRVRVMITLEDTLEKIPAFNTTKDNETTSEIDSQGGTREIVRENTTIQVVTGSEGSLMVLKEVKPTIKGVIVIAEGMDDLETKEMLYGAVKTVLGISGNRVEVYSSK